MPRRYHEYPPEFQVLNVMSRPGASILAVGYLLPLIYLLCRSGSGRTPAPNPWGATGLEWQTPSPPPTDNFDETPVVTEGPYDYPQGELVAQGSRSRIVTAIDHAADTPRHGPLAHQFEDLEQQQHRRNAGDVDLPGHRGHVLRRPVHGLRRLPVHLAPRRSRMASRQLNVWLGTINTVVLLTSSLTMALAVHAGQTRRPPGAGPLPARDDAPGAIFLGIKAFEYYEEYDKHLVPGPELQHASTCDDPAASARRT